MRSFLFIITMFVIASGSINAQYFDSSKELNDTTFRAPKLAIMWTPTQLFGRFSSHMFSLEKRIAHSLNIAFDYGWVNNEEFNEFDKIYFQNKSGNKMVVRVKKYLTSRKSYERPFAALEIFSNHLEYDRNRSFEIPCPGANCSYTENRTYQMKNKQLGIRAVGGYSMSIFGPLLLELEAGLGLRSTKITSTGKPVDYSFLYGKYFSEDGRETNMTMNLSVRLLFQLK